MNKEQSENIRNSARMIHGNYKDVVIDAIDFDLLIEESERVQELKHANDVLSDTLSDMPSIQKGYIKNIEKQNKCYREALEFYADIGNYDEYEDRKLGLIADVLEEGGEKARKALEESE